MARRTLLPSEEVREEAFLDGCKGCELFDSCIVLKYKTKRKICPCKKCIIKMTCKSQCLKRKILIRKNITEYRKYINEQHSE
jgi:hypothetical protein